MNKKTDELLDELNSTEDFTKYLDSNEEALQSITLPRYLDMLLKRYDVKKIDVIRKAEINEIYAYQIFSGKKSPSKDKLISLAFGFGLNLEETQRLLKNAQLPILYAKNKRDSVIIFAINQHYTVVQTNDLLYKNNLDTL